MALTSHQWGSADAAFDFHTCQCNHLTFQFHIWLYSQLPFLQLKRDLAERNGVGKSGIGVAQIEKCNIIQAGFFIPTSQVEYKETAKEVFQN